MITEIIIFGIMAIILAIKLRSILGQHDEDNTSEQSKKYNQKVHDISNASGTLIDITPPVSTMRTKQNIDISSVITPEALIDFNNLSEDMYGMSPFDFIDSAKEVFNMILEAYSNQKKDLLAQLVKPTLLDSITQSFKADQREHIVVVQIVSAIVSKITTTTETIVVDVAFVSEQIRYIDGLDGSILEGSKERVNNVSEKWVFEKRRGVTDDATWLLSSIVN